MWERSKLQYNGASFTRGGKTYPCILSYNPDQHKDYSMWEFRGQLHHHMLESMKLGGGAVDAMVAPRVWMPVEGMQEMSEVQAMVENVLAYLAEHVLHEGCRICGATPLGSWEKLPFKHYLRLRPPSGPAQPACMPAKSNVRRCERGVVWGWSVLPSGYISIYMGCKVEGLRRRPVKELAHRLVCWAFSGPPAEGQECAHLCGCVNCLAPFHLGWVGREQNRMMREWHAFDKTRVGMVCPPSYWKNV